MKLFSGIFLFLSIYLTVTLFSQEYTETDSLQNVLNHMIVKKGDATRDSLTVAKICLKLGAIYNMQDKFDDALIFLNRALRISEVLHDKVIQKSAYDKLSVVHIFMGNFPEAIRCNEKAIKLAEESGNVSEIVKTKLNLGIIYKRQGNNAKALEIFLKAMPYFEQTGNKQELTRLDNCIGGIYLHEGEYEEALKHLTSALEISRGLGHKQEIASNLASIGLVYRAQHNYEAALQNELQAIKIYTELGDRDGIAGALFALGETYAANGNFGKSLESFNKSLRISEKTNNTEIKASCLIGIGEIMINQAAHSDPVEARAKYKKARLCLREAFNLSLMMGQKEHIMNIYRHLFRLDSATGNYRSALGNYQLYSLYKDSLYNIESRNQMARLEVQFVREQKNQEITLLTKENDIKSNEIKWQKRQRNGILFTAALILLVGILVFRGIRSKKKIEQMQAVARERERISADLHDDIGSGLSKIILMLEVLNREAGTPETKDKARAISEESLELSKSMSEVIWALNSRNDNLDSLIAFLRKYAGSYFDNSAIKFRMTAPAHVPPIHLSSEQRRNIFYVVKEALHNIVKHARATEAEIILTFTDQVISILIRDNGVGLPDGELNRFGNGIIQMRKRLQSIGGEFSIESFKGTRIKLSLHV